MGKMRRAVEEWRRYRQIHDEERAEEAYGEFLKWRDIVRESGATRAEIKRVVFEDKESTWKYWRNVV